MNLQATVAEIERAAAEAGVRVRLHARPVDPGRDEAVAIGATDPVVSASVLKVPLAVEFARSAGAGLVDLAEQITVEPDTGPPSPYGLATFRHPATLSWDALATLMIAVSDNVATDLVLERVTKDAVNATLARLGLTGTAVTQSCAEILTSISEDLGIPYDDAERAISHLPVAELKRLRALQPDLTCHTTAEESTRLLSMIWRDEAGPAEACADVRRWLGGQVWPHRLRSGFTGDDVQISGKTGTLPTVRNEIGVVEFDDGERYAVAVFTEAEDATANVPARDALIGAVARTAVTWLRQDVGAASGPSHTLKEGSCAPY